MERIIAYLDDASRLITGYGVFDKATSENAIKVLIEAMDNYGKPESILMRNSVLCFCWREES